MPYYLYVVSDKPNPNITPPAYDIVTEGYDPAKVKRGSQRRNTWLTRLLKSRVLQRIGGRQLVASLVHCSTTRYQDRTTKG